MRWILCLVAISVMCNRGWGLRLNPVPQYCRRYASTGRYPSRCRTWPHTPLWAAEIDAAGLPDESTSTADAAATMLTEELPPVKRKRGRPRKTDGDGGPAKKAKAPAKKRLTRAQQEEIEMKRVIQPTTLVLVSAEPPENMKLQDNAFLASIKDRCMRKYGDALHIEHAILEYEEEEVTEEGEVTHEGDAHMQREQPEHDSELLEMWIEAPAGVCRLMSRRSKTPLDLSAELEEEAMEKISDFMAENRHYNIDVFRDDTNFPELS